MDPNSYSVCEELSHSIASFALRFSNELERSKTTICSPLSAEIVLAMLALGCKGQSHAELMKALDFSDDEALRSSFGLLTSNLKSMKGATLNVANKIYLKKNQNIKSGIKRDIEDVFDSSLEQLDFEEKVASADVINKWVAQRTNNLIKDVVSVEMFNDKTSMVLINAIHFKGYWAKKFMKGATKDKNFYVNKNTILQVPQMYQDAVYLNYGFSSKLNASLLQMHYEGLQSSMVIVLPREVEGLSDMMHQLAAGHNLMDDINALKKRKVDVTIPKFKAEMTINLKTVLSELGIKSIFNELSSDIDMLTSNDRLFVSEAIQKAFIEVNEAGTEAAASSASFIQLCCLNPQFVADHPFLYLIFAQSIPIFVGTYYGPQ